MYHTAGVSVVHRFSDVQVQKHRVGSSFYGFSGPAQFWKGVGEEADHRKAMRYMTARASLESRLCVAKLGG